jgi:alkaline phosphatase D
VALLAAAAPASARGFRFGVAAGEVTSSSAALWTRADRPGTVTLQVSRDRRFRGGVTSYRLRARRSDDNTIQRRVRGLRAGRRYFYRFVRGRAGARARVSAPTSSRGTFMTAPRPSANATVRFGWTGDTDFTRAPGQSRPHWNTGGVFRRMARERNHFNVHMGDVMYSDTEVPFPGGQPPPALSVASKWAKYRLNLGNANLRAMRAGAGMYSHWDDHEFINDFSRPENVFDPSGPGALLNANGQALYNRGVRAFTDYEPDMFSRSRGLYRSFRWGRNVELFFLDERSFRSAKASAGGVCDNPQTGRPDFAPTAPQRIRNTFALIAPSLAQPVSPACLAAIRSPDRSMLGSGQFNRFTRAVERSPATWKIIMNEVPIQQYYILPYDAWEGYEAERQRMINALRNVRNVIFLTTDTHATLVNDARLSTFPEEGGTQNSGIFDFVVGPVATANFGLEIDNTLNRPGSGNLARDAFLKQAPPNGPGARCAVVDQFSYGEVQATRSRLTVTSKGINGKPLRDCPALMLQRR